MKFFDITVKKSYKTKTGEEKNAWNKVGKVTQFDDGGLDVEIFTLPKLHTFEQKPKTKQEQDAF